MTALSTDQIMTLVEFLMIVLGIAITWAVYYGSDRAELPGDARVPPPGVADDMTIDTRGRTF